MSHRLAHLAQRIFNVPLAIHPRKAEIVVAALSDRLGVSRVEVGLSSDDPFARQGRAGDAGYDVIGGVGIVEVSGTLVNKLGSLRPWSGMTGYDGIRQNFLAALTDPDVRAIMLDIDSPGGEAGGCFDLVDLIYSARGTKPIWAVLSESAYSAAYAIASAADRITVPRTGGTGSIGVITAHVDMSRALDAAGLKVTFITYGDFKADGRPELPLSDEALARIAGDINTMGELFVETVARNRAIAADRVRDMQAGTFLGAAGVEAGLADAVMPPDQAFRSLLQTLQ